MTRTRLAIYLLTVASATVSAQTPAITTFKARAEALRRIDAARQDLADPQAAAEMALHWAEALDRTARAIPFGSSSKAEPYASWIRAHQTHVAYNEPGGHWMLRRDTVVNLHKIYPAMEAADDIAWLLVTVGVGGECEGYLPCYVERQNLTYGEYLRLHPTGRHADDAVRILQTWISSLVRDEDGLKKMFVPADHCSDLKASVSTLRGIVAKAGAYRSEDVTRGLDALLGWCR
jgi:hypothetical protein